MATPEQIASVIDLVENGSSESAACREVGINRSTFRQMAFRLSAGNEYARALTGLAHQQVEMIEKVIDDMREGVIDAAQARVEIDARKWTASKFLPKQYGDRLDLNAKTETTVHITDSLDLTHLSAEQREALKEIAQALLDRRAAQRIEGPEEG